jgi:alkanesulfonate monooxygenase SsuD/methylene tetrahydromethanopterin reductase-like flavin-dependent oxidoreductase (luciferase family)
MTPEYIVKAKPWLEEGVRRAGNGKSLDDIEIQSAVQVIITDDVKAGLASMKPNAALYVGGMGHKDLNFHKNMMISRGYGDAAERIQDLFLAGRKDEAAAAVPDEFIDEAALIGPKARIKKRYRNWVDAGFSGLTVGSQQEEAVRFMAEIAGLNREPGA